MSDSNLAELHEFARALGIPRRGFDLDHYDVPEKLYARALELGAVAVTARGLLFALQKAGLRVRQVEKDGLRPIRREEFLQNEWLKLGRALDFSSKGESREAKWKVLGADLLSRWHEPHRHYHDAQHLEDVLLALDMLKVSGSRIEPETLLAVWFHDAIYQTRPGADEHESAKYSDYALRDLGFGKPLREIVYDSVMATDPARSYDGQDSRVLQLLDADIWVFASRAERYSQYAKDVRAEYAHVSEADFRFGRSAVLTRFLEKPALYKTPHAQKNWELAARKNVATELAELDMLAALREGGQIEAD